MSEMPLPSPQIGKDVIESLTSGMYEDSRFIFREYVQNAADAIDKAVEFSILKKEEGNIHILIDEKNRTISVYDNATGIPKEDVASVLCNIAHSTKMRGEDKGFRGIGRLGGLGYCSKLTFETSYSGESEKSILTWDAGLLKSIINNRERKEDAVDVIKKVVSFNTEEEEEDVHYFRVTMENVSSKELLDAKNVREYLSMVAPIDIASQFFFRNKINEFKKKHGLNVDTYKIYVNEDQIFKPYTAYIYEDNNGGKKRVDDIEDVEFLLSKDQNGDVLYWGWYSISGLKGQMKKKNIARGIRLRKENIQIGDEEICKNFFSNTDDQRFSFYFFGEIHAVSKGLIPNSRRDYFSETAEREKFETYVKQDFLKLKDLCYGASTVRKFTETKEKTDKLEDEIKAKEQDGYSSKKEQEKLQQQLVEQKKKEDKARKDLERTIKKVGGDDDSPLKKYIKRHEPNPQDAHKEKVVDKENDSQYNQDTPKIKFITDRLVYSRYSKQEKKLIGRIYEAIEEAIADEKLRDALINKIEEHITK